ncbi:MAG: BtpA/SgcQ family protein [Planctomycetota bacterium]
MGSLQLRGLIGVVHLLPTPGAPAGRPGGGMDELLEGAVRDAAAFVEGGVSQLVVENYHDAPFWKAGVAAETIAALALAVDRVRRVDGVDGVGVNVLRNDARAALGIAAATGAGFVRVNVHTGAMFTDQGLIEGLAAETLRERARLAPSVQILADVHVKHATPIQGEAIEDAARDAVHRGRADGLIVSGVATGSAPSAERVAQVRAAVGDSVPILIGSGFRLENAGELLAHADGAIVGTAAKVDGVVAHAVDPQRVAALVQAAAKA